MANKDHLDILRAGVRAWNDWRERENLVRPDLSNAYLREYAIDDSFSRLGDLRSIDLRKANLQGAILNALDLSHSDLSSSSLYGASIRESSLHGSEIMEADLSHADLRKTVLLDANLCGSGLIAANLAEAVMRRADLTEAWVGHTTFLGNDLSEVIGLGTVRHGAPSFIGIDTIRLSKGAIPQVFLRGCGLSDLDVEFAKLANHHLNNEEVTTIGYKIIELHASRPVQITPLFISYSHSDAQFVEKMEDSLNERGVRSWRDVHHATAGRLDKIIDRAMRLNPTVLLVLSEHSVNSDWVEHEAAKARELEKKLKRDVLCPVALDDSWKNCEWSEVLRRQVSKYRILPFSNWQDDRVFTRQFNKLVEGLHIFYRDAKPSE
jgi:uncharacterized protein YjbI with pentapeptide repeats